MKRCTFIVSPGGNGNHMWNEILQAAGSVQYGDNDFGDPCLPSVAGYDTIHWFRSFPSQRYRLEELESMVCQVRDWGFEIKAIIPVRDWYCAARSQMSRHGVSDYHESYQNMLVGYPYILTTLSRLEVPWMLVTYSGAVNYPEYIHWVLKWLGLVASSLPEIRDENRKWYRLD